MEIRNGDFVHVRMRVDDERPTGESVLVVVAGGRRYPVPREDIVKVEPQPFAAGDVVRVKPYVDNWVVVAVDGSWVWLRPANRRGVGTLVPVSGLDRA